MLNILLTYDYELFFNDCDYPEKDVLIDTTNEIADMLGSCHSSATFFVDMGAVLRYEELNLYEFPVMVEQQINTLLTKMHDIQLHIHPIWFGSERRDNKWIFDNQFYRLHSFIEDKEWNMKRIIVESKKRLEEMVKDNHPEHNVIAFRAGGFCIQPEKEILKELSCAGIKVDLSVCKDMYLDSKAQFFDFRDVPDKVNWRIDYKMGLGKDAGEKGSIFEIPVGTYGCVPGKWLLTHGMPKLNYPPCKGKHTPVEEAVKSGCLQKMKKRVCAAFTQPVQFTNDILHANALLQIVQKYLKKYDCKENDYYIALIGHPKFSSKECCENTRQFIEMVYLSNWPVKFITVSEAYRQIFEKE